MLARPAGDAVVRALVSAGTSVDSGMGRSSSFAEDLKRPDGPFALDEGVTGRPMGLFGFRGILLCHPFEKRGNSVAAHAADRGPWPFLGLYAPVRIDIACPFAKGSPLVRGFQVCGVACGRHENGYEEKTPSPSAAPHEGRLA
jgi:hypothetical protein